MSYGRGRGPEKRSHGYPIQIYFEAVNVGKSLQGTKKRIKWRFGWSESPEEQEIELIHSLVSSKKTLLEDGQEIHSVSSVTATTFNHAWHSHGLYVFRVEVITSMLEDATYLFTIDGVRFSDWQRKGVNRKINDVTKNAGRYNNDEYSREDEDERRPVNSTRQHQNGAQRQQQRTANNSSSNPKQQHARNSDTFFERNDQAVMGADSGTFDPFSPTAASNNSFDPFAGAAKTAPQQRAASSTRSSASRIVGGFENFDDPPEGGGASQKSPTAIFDPFSIPSATDPFAIPASTFSGQRPQANSFSDFNAAPAPVSAPKARTASADLLSMDFVGMSFQQQAPTASSTTVFRDPSPTVAVSAPAGGDAYANLVNLDLSGKGSAPPYPSNSIISGPSLNSMMGNSYSKSAPVTGMTTMGGAYGQPSALAPSLDPFGAPALQSASALPAPMAPIQSFQQMQPMQSMSRQVGSAVPVNPFAAMRPSGAPMGGMGAQPSMGSPAPMMPNFAMARGAPLNSMAPPRPMFPASSSFGAPQQPKSSLDSIDPFKSP